MALTIDQLIDRAVTVADVPKLLDLTAQIPPLGDKALPAAQLGVNIALVKAVQELTAAVRELAHHLPGV